MSQVVTPRPNPLPAPIASGAFVRPIPLAQPPAKLLPLILIAFYVFTLWNTPPLQIQWRWFTVMGLILVAFLLQGNRQINFKSASVLLIVLSLQFIGGISGVLRATDPMQVLYNGVGFVVTILSTFLMSQLLVYKQARQLFLLACIVAALFWSIEIFGRTAELGERAALTFISTYADVGGDKNFLSLILAIACATLISFAIFYAPREKKTFYRFLRIGAVVLSAVFLSASALTYSRTGMVAVLLAIAFPVVIFLINRRKYVALLLAFVVGYVFIANVALPYLQTTYPRWSLLLERLNEQNIYDFNQGRFETLEKTWVLISDNPLIGVGFGEYKSTFVDVNSRHSAGTSAHNTVLGGIAEGGLLVAISFIIVGIVYAKLFREPFSRMITTDRMMLLALFPFMFMMFFLDLGGSFPIMLASLSVMAHEYARA